MGTNLRLDETVAVDLGPNSDGFGLFLKLGTNLRLAGADARQELPQSRQKTDWSISARMEETDGLSKTARLGPAGEDRHQEV